MGSDNALQTRTLLSSVELTSLDSLKTAAVNASQIASGTERPIHSSALTDWRRQRDAGAFEALSPFKRGPKIAAPNPLAAEHAQLLCDNKRLTLRLQRAEAVIAIQKKCLPCWVWPT